MVRIAIATEAKVFLKAQSDVYKDLNMVELQTEMLTNPAMGIITAMLPSVYHIKGVSGHFNLTLANMNGTSLSFSSLIQALFEFSILDRPGIGH